MGDTGRKKRKASGEHKTRSGTHKSSKSADRKFGSADRRALSSPAGPTRSGSPFPLVIVGALIPIAFIVGYLAMRSEAPSEPKAETPAVAKATPPAPPPAASPAVEAPAPRPPAPKEAEPEPEKVPGPAPQTPPPEAPSEPKAAKGDTPKGVPSSAVKARVVRCMDGDTLLVSMGGKDEKIRMKGVDTPETVHPTKPVEKFGKEASNFTKARLDKKTVWIELDPAGRDKYGRLLGFVWCEDGTCHNATLIREGYAHAYTRYPFDRMEEYRKLEREAREAKRGLWAP